MFQSEFNPGGFLPRTDSQERLFEDFKKLRGIFGPPHRFAYLRSVARTRKHTRSIYPPGWKFR